MTTHRLENSDGELLAGPPAAQLRLLVVDSDPAQREEARDLLSALGYDAETVGDGAQALQRCNEDAPAAVLVPFDSHVHDGTRTVDALKAMQCDGQLPLFPVIGTINDPSAADQDDRSVDGMVTMPLRLSSLASELTRCAAAQAPAATADVPEVDDSATETP